MLLNSAPRMTIAIIGGGASGALLAIQLLRRTTQPLTLLLIDPHEQPGYGVAYGTPYERHLLNVPAARMSSFEDDPDHFLRWARLHHDNAAQADSFLPRALFGRYLSATLATEIAQRAPCVKVQHIRARALALRPMLGGAEVLLEHLGVRYADQVVLALGNARPATPFPTPAWTSRLLSGYSWPLDPRVRNNEHGPLIIVGSGLSMVDVVLALEQAGQRVPILVVSRHGLLPLPHRPVGAYPPWLAPHEQPASVRVLLRLLRAEVEAAHNAGVDWRAVVDGLRPYLPALWQGLPPKERRRFLRHVRAHWDVHRHRIAPQVDATLQRMRATGQLTIRAGRIVQYRENHAQATISLRPRGADALEEHSAAYVLNCTSPHTDYAQLDDPLIQQLLRMGLLVPDPLRLGVLATPQGQLLDRAGAPSTWLWTLGPPLKSVLWESTAIPEIRRQAASLAQTLLEGDAPAAGYRHQQERIWRHTSAFDTTL
jgi:uncharacterized NAD(P)/FAD-binding protein YdhS